MERTARNLKEIENIMHTDEKIIALMDMLADEADRQGLTAKQWGEFKIRMLTEAYYRLAEQMPELQDDIAMDIYEELTEK